MAGRTVWLALVSLAVAAGLAMPAYAAKPVVVLEAGGAQLRLFDRKVGSARLVEEGSGRVEVHLELVPSAARALEKLSEANLNRPINFYAGGRIYYSLITSVPISDGEIQFTGLSLEEATAIVWKLD